jgi:hypothetical protein
LFLLLLVLVHHQKDLKALFVNLVFLVLALALEDLLLASQREQGTFAQPH